MKTKEYLLKTPYGGFFCGWGPTRHARTTKFPAVAIALKEKDAKEIMARLPSYRFTPVPVPG